MATQADFDFISGTLPGTNPATNIVGGTDGTSILHTELSSPLTSAGDFGRLYEIQLPPGPTTLLRADGSPGSTTIVDDGTNPSAWTIISSSYFDYFAGGVVGNPDYATDGFVVNRDYVTSLSGTSGPNHYANVILGVNQKVLSFGREYGVTNPSAEQYFYDLSGSYFSLTSAPSLFSSTVSYPGINNPSPQEDINWYFSYSNPLGYSYDFSVNNNFVLGIGEYLTVEWWMAASNIFETFSVIESPYLRVDVQSNNTLELRVTDNLARYSSLGSVDEDGQYHNYIIVIKRTSSTGYEVTSYKDGQYIGGDNSPSSTPNSLGIRFATGNSVELGGNQNAGSFGDNIFYGDIYIYKGNPYGIVTYNGNPATISYQPRHYSIITRNSAVGSSFIFDGTVNSFTRANSCLRTVSPVCNFANGDFNIDFWYMAKSISSPGDGRFFIYTSLSNGVLDSRNSNTSSNGIALYINADSDVTNLNIRATFDVKTNTDYIGSLSFYPGTWNHLCVSREGGILRTFINGVKDIEQIDTSFISDSNAVLIGDTLNSANAAGLLEELVIRAGTAKYTENFTPPTQGTPASEENNSLVMSCLKSTVDSGAWLTSGSNAYSVRGSFRIEQNGAVFSAQNQVACGLSVKTGGWSDYQFTDTTNTLPFGYHFYIGEIKDFPYYNSSTTHTNFYLASHKGARRRLSSLSRDGSNRVVGAWSTNELISGGGALSTTYSPGDKIYIRESGTSEYNGEYTILSATSTGFVTNETVGVNFSGTNYGLLYDDRNDVGGFSKNIDVVTIPGYNYTLDTWVRMRMDVIPFGQWDSVTLYLATDPDVTPGSENWQKIYSEKFYHSSNSFIPYLDAKMHNKVGYFVNNRKDTINLENIPKIIIDNFVALAEDVTL